MQKLFMLVYSQWFIFAFDSLAKGDTARKELLQLMSKTLLPMFSCRNFMVSGLTFKSSIHFELIFVYGIRKWSSGACVAQSVKRLTQNFSSGHDLVVCGIKPHSGLCTNSVKPF